MLPLIACLVLSAFIDVSSAASASWSYDDHHGNGPSTWKASYPQCDGTKQSPIDIKPASTTHDSSFGAFTLTGYDTATGYTSKLSNNGHTVQLMVGSSNMILTGAGLPGTFQLVQFHLHWGSSNDVGSEHTVDGTYYPLEIHLVHFNNKYPNVTSAVPHSDGLAVLGMFAEIGNTRNEALQKIIDQFDKVTYADQETIVDAFSMNPLLPSNLVDFVRYDGSLTTPACQESVTWTVFKEPVSITQTQLNAFRALNHNAAGMNADPLVNNYRPVQPVGSRRVRRSYATVTGSTNTGHRLHGGVNFTISFGSAVVIALATVVSRQ